MTCSPARGRPQPPRLSHPTGWGWSAHQRPPRGPLPAVAWPGSVPRGWGGWPPLQEPTLEVTGPLGPERSQRPTETPGTRLLKCTESRGRDTSAAAQRPRWPGARSAAEPPVSWDWSPAWLGSCPVPPFSSRSPGSRRLDHALPDVGAINRMQFFKKILKASILICIHARAHTRTLTHTKCLGSSM